MKVIIAGSREISDYTMGKKLIEKAVKENKIEVSEILCGLAKGADLIGKEWGKSNDIPVKDYPANWKDIDVPNALVKENQFGKYNARAGFDRNQDMVDDCDVAIFLWDMESSGTEDCIKRVQKANKPHYIMTPEMLVAKENTEEEIPF